MIEQIPHLPPNVVGLRAWGRLQREDLEEIARPALANAKQRHDPTHVLLDVNGATGRPTPATVRVAARLAKDQLVEGVERCAVISDSKLVRRLVRSTGKALPMTVDAFEDAERSNAIDWLSRPAVEHGLAHQYLSDARVLVLLPKDILHVEDFEALTERMRSLRESGAPVHGVIVRTAKLPKWSNLGALIRHVRFVRTFHEEIARIAIVSDAQMARTIAAIVERFVDADVRWYGALEFEVALQWASAPRATRSNPSTGDNGRSRKIDRVIEAGLESFPASDPPSFTPQT
jgi:hypothetical protein